MGGGDLQWVVYFELASLKKFCGCLQHDKLPENSKTCPLHQQNTLSDVDRLNPGKLNKYHPYLEKTNIWNAFHEWFSKESDLDGPLENLKALERPQRRRQVSRPLCLSFYLLIHLSIYLSTYLLIYLSIHLSIYIFLYLLIYLSIYLS